MEQDKPIVVFNAMKADNFARLVAGETIGTKIS
jgi:isopentenyl phosphate kinase